MAKKTKANLQYTTEGSDKPAVGDFMVYNGSEFVPGPKRLLVSVKPLNLDRTSPFANVDDGRIGNGQIQIMPIVQIQTITGYNQGSGIWTCPESGYYNLGFFVNYSRRVDENGWYHPEMAGMMTAGLCSPTGHLTYVANALPITLPLKHINITGSSILYITASTQICLKVMNSTGYDYVANGSVQSGDIVKMSILKI